MAELSIKYIKLLWRIAVGRLLLYVMVTVGTAFGIATYNVPFSKMDSDQRFALFISLAILAAKDFISFLDASAKRIEAGNFMPPDPPDTDAQKQQLQSQKPAQNPPLQPVLQAVISETETTK